MAGLTPPMAEMIAQLVVRHISSTGACVIDLPAAAPALDMCTSIEIRIHEQDVVERHPDSICITPSRPVTVGQDPPRAKHPLANSPGHPGGGGGEHSPWWTTGWPRGPEPGEKGPDSGPGPGSGHPGKPGGGPGRPGAPWGHGGHGGPGGPWDHGGHGGGGGGGHEWMPPKHGSPGGHGGHGDGGGGGGDHEWMPPEHGGPPKHLPPPGPMPMKEEPPARPDPPTQPNPPARPDGPRPAPGRSPLQPAAVPPDKGGDGSGSPPGSSPSPSPPPDSAPPPPPPPPPPAQPTEPEPPGFIKVSTSLPPPPPASTLQSTSSSTPDSTPTPTPTQTPTQTPSPPPERSQEPPPPDPPQASASPPPPPPSRPASPPPSPPAPAPGFCASAYATIDVSELSGVNPHSYGQYLSLLGHNNIGPGIPGGAHPDIPGHPHHPHHPHHQDGGSGITLAQGKKALVHQYRVRCGVEMPNGPDPVFPGFGGGKEHARTVTDGHRGCLETCEREAIAMATQGLLTECLGAAYREIIGVLGGSGNGDEGGGGKGECRFWYGDGMEHEFLPVHSLRDAHLDVNRWQILYM
ncbi:hypothetical protein GGR51DRAFT_570169 [Nemania sp. FL0031]|nr:hypothetical protein GGR51DRAFT_570169 [Nemania sp. FL0031]